MHTNPPMIFSNDNFQVIKKIGDGLFLENEKGLLAMRFSQCSGEGIELKALHQGQVLSFWIDETQWCDWISTTLPFPSLAEAPTELHAALAQCTLAILENWLPIENIAALKALSLTKCALEPTFLWVVDAIEENRLLSLAILTAPSMWLIEMATHLDGGMDQEIVEAPTKKCRSLQEKAYALAQRSATLKTWPMPCLVGYLYLDDATCASLKLGDALILEKFSLISQGELWLRQEKMLYSLFPHQPQHYQIQAITQLIDENDTQRVDFFSTMPDDNTAQSNHPLAQERLNMITAEIGQINLPLNDLNRLDINNTLMLTPQFYPNAKLRLGDKYIAQGQLMKLGQGWVVRIEQI